MGHYIDSNHPTPPPTPQIQLRLEVLEQHEIENMSQHLLSRDGTGIAFLCFNPIPYKSMT